MKMTIDLTPDETTRLEQAAEQRGMKPDEYARVLLNAGSEIVPPGIGEPNTPRRPMTGAEAHAFWQRAGVLGTFSDRPDSPEFARELRHRAQRWKEQP